ncbi:g5653 [Coccomyxa elongata]
MFISHGNRFNGSLPRVGDDAVCGPVLIAGDDGKQHITAANPSRKTREQAGCSRAQPLGQPSQERTRRLAAQTFSWRTTSGHGGQLPSSGLSGTACDWPPSTSSGQPTRHQPDAAQSAGAVAARILSSSRKALLGDWRLATVTIRQTASVLSDWLRDPKLTREEFRERWCHRDVLCVLGAEPDAQLLIHCSAHHPVPLPA